MMKKRKGTLLKNKIIIISFGLFVLSFLIGCESEKETQKTVQVKAPVVTKKVEKKVEKQVEKPKVTYVYDAKGKRDPFKSFIKKQKVQITKPKVPLTPLQEYDISQLKLTGIITGTGEEGENRAMVADPTGKGFILKKGTLIGRNFGRVERIEEKVVIIIEDVQDFLGNIITKEIPLTLETEGGE
jgi:type IV pilus assembly protein PilP